MMEPADSAAGPRGVAAALRHLRPLGAGRSARALRLVNQPDGFDCPGCAWPEAQPASRHTFEFCENGVKALAEEATTRRVDGAFFARHSVDELALRDDAWLGRQGRLVEPVIRRSGDTHYRPIAWDDAVGLVADELTRLDNPDRAVFYTSGRASNEAAWCWQLLARLLGTNNLPDCSNLCHESSGSALVDALGVGKGTVSLDDFTHAQLIVVAGQNPGTNHPRMLATLAAAKDAGARIVAVNPLPEAGLLGFRDPQRPSGWIGRARPLADVHLPIRLGGDLALWQLLGRLLVEARADGVASAVDESFVRESCTGFEEWVAHVRQVDWSAALAATGLDDAAVRSLGRELVAADRVIVCWAMGLTQHRHAVDTLREVTNVMLAKGAVGRPGAGLCPVRGHSNVQGDRTMGIWERPSEAFLARMEDGLGVRLPRHHGFDVVGAIEAMERGDVDVALSLGGNLVGAAPDSRRTEAAMSRCRLTVQVSTKLNRSHVHGGSTALILPVLARSDRHVTAAGEQFVTVEDSMSNVHASRGGLVPVSPNLRSEVAVICDLAARLTGNDVVDWSACAEDHTVVRRWISRTIAGFDDMERRVQQPGGLVIAHPVRDRRDFATPDRRAHFAVIRRRDIELPDGALLLQTLRSHDQFNTTVYDLDDRYRGVRGQRRVVFVNTDDLAEHGLVDGDRVDIVGCDLALDGPANHGEVDDVVERRAVDFAVVEYPTPRGCAAAYFPEANAVVPLSAVDPTSRTPAYKSVVVRLERRESR